VFLDDHPIGRVFSEMDVRFGPLQIYQPDVMFISKSRMVRRTPRIHVVPEMVLEILSPGTKGRDLGTKKADYERFGVDEYWIIDPAAKRQFSCLRRKGDALVGVTVPARSFKSQAVPGFALDLVALRRVILDQ
jgi:Uma2 family endonuclease